MDIDALGPSDPEEPAPDTIRVHRWGYNAGGIRWRHSVDEYIRGTATGYPAGIMRASVELDAWADSHATLRAGHGNTDDAKAFARWLRALAEQIAAGQET